MNAIKPGTRTNFVDGMLLTAEVFRTEQRYFNRRVQHYGRLFGSGVLKGLHVTCRGHDGKLTIESGVAIDPCGCDLFLSDTRKIGAEEGLLCISRAPPIEETGAAIGALPAACDDRGAQTGPATKSPVLRTTEQIAFCYADDANEITDRHLVPIAWVQCADGEWQVFQMPRLESVSPRAAVPSFVTAIYPEHGARCSAWTESWCIEFSTPIEVPPPEAFEIHCAEQRSVSFNVMDLRVEADPCKLLFTVTVDPKTVTVDPKEEEFAGATIIWRLHCDFVVDKRGVPVSGAHFVGRLPSRGGVAGGVFQSWFKIAEARE
jgi:hypothetical protein